jgi:hypothetical protein
MVAPCLSTMSDPRSTNFREHFYNSCSLSQPATSAADRWMEYAKELERQNELLVVALDEALRALTAASLNHNTPR